MNYIHTIYLKYLYLKFQKCIQKEMLNIIKIYFQVGSSSNFSPCNGLCAIVWKNTYLKVDSFFVNNISFRTWKLRRTFLYFFKYYFYSCDPGRATFNLLYKKPSYFKLKWKKTEKKNADKRKEDWKKREEKRLPC